MSESSNSNNRTATAAAAAAATATTDARYENSLVLPPEFVVEGNSRNLDDNEMRHRAAFYQCALSHITNKADNGGMMNKEKYTQIHTAILRHHLGERLTDIKKDGNPLIYSWVKKYAILDVGETHVLVERPPKPAEGGEVAAPDQDRIRRPTYLERLYEDMLLDHGLHSMCTTFHKRLAAKYSNIAMPWVKMFTATCPGCITKAKTQKPMAGLRNIITNNVSTLASMVAYRRPSSHPHSLPRRSSSTFASKVTRDEYKPFASMHCRSRTIMRGMGRNFYRH